MVLRYRGLCEHSRSRPKMRPRRAMNEERMTYIHIPAEPGCSSSRSEERGGRQLDVAVEHASLAEWCKHAWHIEVRSHENFRWCVLIAHVREQEQHQESATAALHVHPPPSVDIVTAVDVPAGVARISRAREPNGNRSANASGRNPTARGQKLVVYSGQRSRRPGRCERGPLGTGEADDRLGPRCGIERINPSGA